MTASTLLQTRSQRVGWRDHTTDRHSQQRNLRRISVSERERGQVRVSRERSFIRRTAAACLTSYPDAKQQHKVPLGSWQARYHHLEGTHSVVNGTERHPTDSNECMKSPLLQTLETDLFNPASASEVEVGTKQKQRCDNHKEKC